MNSAFFFQTQQIHDNSNLFDELKQQKIFFSYFQVDRNYYLFLYAQKSMEIDFIYQSIHLIQELDSKQRKIRSFRGFFLYAKDGTIVSDRNYRKRKILRNFTNKSSTLFLRFAQQHLKILFDKIKRQLYKNSYSKQQRKQ
jgi:hypothetical protein